MSLTGFIAAPDVRAKIKPLRPKLPRKIRVPLKVEPRSNSYMVVGKAFDYLLRFELQRRAPHAVTRKWVAEYAPDLIWYETDKGGVGILIAEPNSGNYISSKEVAERASAVIKDAKVAVARYLKSKIPNRTKQAELAGHAIRLARLDSVYRALEIDPRSEEADPEDIQDLVDMLIIVPFDRLLHKKLLFLNSDFGDSSRLVGGADTDLIAGDLLVDFKTTKSNEMQGKDLDQLLGYFLLARHRRRSDPTFPAINRLGLYYCRHGYLWTVETKIWTDHAEFLEIEEWFLKRAKEVYGAER